MEKEMEKIPFYRDGSSEKDEFYVLGETTQGGLRYILVADDVEDGGKCLILKEEGCPKEDDVIYSVVTDDTETAALAKVFEELLEDVEIGL